METCNAVLTDPVMYLEIYKAKINKKPNEGVYWNNDGKGNEDVSPKYKFALFVTK